MRNSSITENTAANVAVCIPERDRDDPPPTNFIPAFSAGRTEELHATTLSDEQVSDYLLLPPRILRQACRDVRRDQAGCKCPDCGLRGPCERQAR